MPKFCQHFFFFYPLLHIPTPISGYGTNYVPARMAPAADGVKMQGMRNGAFKQMLACTLALPYNMLFKRETGKREMGEREFSADM